MNKIVLLNKLKMKRIFMFIAAAFIALTAAAQGVMQLPNDEAIVTGQLPNGLKYYLLHNDKPAQTAEFYLATDAGAFQETDDQDGLAHFLEHMCFNGTKNFPGKNLLNYLQSIGAEFGRNINASTGFEETQYMLNNIPIVRESIIDSCLLIMHDYSHFVTCDPAEIDAERGVILEERRTRRTADWRASEKTLPYYFAGTPYAKRTLIGAEEQLKTFKPESLVNFYKAWYQPDNQALIVVGDIDVKLVEEKIKTIFSDIPAPETPTVKPVHMPLLNEEPAVAIITDAEAQASSLEILWKTEAFPKEMKNTNVGFTIDLINSFISQIMSERFDDITADPASPFLSASFGFGGLCNECDVAMGNLTFKEGQAIPAFTAFMTEIEKLKRFGFTEGEVQRAKDNIISYYEKKVEGASSRKNPEFISPILRNFYDNEPILNPEMELELEGKGGLLSALENRFSAGKTHAVIVVAEGAGQNFFAGTPERRDASGNVLKNDIGEYLKRKISAHFKEKGVESSVKYFDPSYTIRSVPARGTDAIRCYMLARNAVHAAMAGRTNCVIGNLGESYALVPIKLATIERQKISLKSDLWRTVMDATGQEFYFSPNKRASNLPSYMAP